MSDAEGPFFLHASSQNGISLFPDVQRELSEMVRVTKPDGQVLVLAFSPSTEAEFLTVFGEQ